MAQASFWTGTRVLLTGHTGFKGSWLLLWLLELGAEVWCYALEPEPWPNLFRQLEPDLNSSTRYAGRWHHRTADLADRSQLKATVSACQPEVVLHLAAQPLVRLSYADPIGTWSTNVMGSLHLLESLRDLEHPCPVVMITTDKVYANQEWEFGYRESDALGGIDPYSASKAGAEIAIQSWRSSFCGPAPHQTQHLAIATARAGNVIGGGDYADDRIVPDLVRALAAGQALGVRSPGSTRPWQHVLDCLSGYLALARWLATDPSASRHCERAFNFGPTQESERTVGDLVEECLRHWPGRWEDLSEPGAPHEATRLAVSIERSRAVLGWRPNWDFPTAVAETIEWYRARTEGASPSELRGIMNRQIAAFEA